MSSIAAQAFRPISTSFAIRISHEISHMRIVNGCESHTHFFRSNCEPGLRTILLLIQPMRSYISQLAYGFLSCQLLGKLNWLVLAFHCDKFF